MYTLVTCELLWTFC